MYGFFGTVLDMAVLKWIVEEGNSKFKIKRSRAINPCRAQGSDIAET